MSLMSYLIIANVVIFIGITVYAFATARAALKECGKDFSWDLKIFKWTSSHGKAVGIIIILAVLTAIWLVGSF